MFKAGVRSTVLLGFLFLLPAFAWPQPASLVLDINQSARDRDSFPSGLLSALGKVFFTAEEPSSGAEVWVSDGTSGGTMMLADSCPGECSSAQQILGSNGRGVFWVGADSETRSRLWWSDGTRPGSTVLRQDTLEISRSGEDGLFTFAGGILYFVGCTSGQGCDLWRSDGSEGGTRPLLSTPRWQSFSLGGLKTVGREVYFIAQDLDEGEPAVWKTDGTESGTLLIETLEIQPRRTVATVDRFFFAVSSPDGEAEELWASDGTEAGTLRLASFPEGQFGSDARIFSLKPVGRRLYFVADDVIHGWEIWRSDGTPQGTAQVTDFGFHDPFENELDSAQIEEIGNRVVFRATDGLSETRLWASSGTHESTVPLAELCLPSRFCSDFVPWRMVKVGGKVLFRGADASRGLELWATDGTPAGTRRLADACPGPCNGMFSHPVLAGSTVYFIAEILQQDGLVRHELWRSDGTPQGTRRFAPLANQSLFEDLVVVAVGGKVFFPAEDQYGRELWVSDGTPEGTGLVENIARDDDNGSNPQALTAQGDRLFFTACDRGSFSNAGVWRSAGTPQTTALAGELSGGCFDLPRQLTPLGENVFFAREGQLWRTDGTPAGSLQLTPFDRFGDQFVESSFAAFQSKLFFPVYNRGAAEIWSSDGSPAGTAKAFELPPGIEDVFELASLGSDLFFTASIDNDSSGLHLWKTDGTTARTVRLSSEPVGSRFDSRPLELARLGAITYIASQQLWRTDGTPAGTSLVRRLGPFGEDDEITDLTVFQGALYFFGRAPEFDKRALWRSGGTAATTQVIREFENGRFFDPQPGELTVFGSRFFFAANDGVHGRELWQSDGTEAGTTLVRDIRPGPEASRPADLIVAGGRLFFAAGDALNGRELWSSDGTAAGTRLHQDIAPEGTSSSPQDLTLAGNRLFFSADDGLTGREVWSLPLGAGAGCLPSATSLCLKEGRFRVEISWRDFAGRTGMGQAVALTTDTGYFWFFGPENVEVVVKVLDGLGVNGHHWVFYGALSSVEYTVAVTDAQTGLTRHYFNPSGRLGSVGDTQAFGPLGAFAPLTAGLEAEASQPEIRESIAAATGPCVEGPTRLCLNGGRFAVEVSWKDFSGNTGAGQAVRLTGDTGYFWFFNAANVEVVLKVLDGRPVNDKFWVFYGALSSVEYTITVTDTMTGQVKTYRNPSGRLGSVADTGAF